MDAEEDAQNAGRGRPATRHNPEVRTESSAATDDDLLRREDEWRRYDRRVEEVRFEEAVDALEAARLIDINKDEGLYGRYCDVLRALVDDRVAIDLEHETKRWIEVNEGKTLFDGPKALAAWLKRAQPQGAGDRFFR